MFKADINLDGINNTVGQGEVYFGGTGYELGDQVLGCGGVERGQVGSDGI